MPQHRVTLVLGPNVQLGGSNPAVAGTVGSLYSWTESWYRNVNETDAQCFTWSRALVLARRYILTSGWRVSAIRLAVFPNSRTASRQYLAPNDGQGFYNVIGDWLAGNATALDEQPYDTLVHACASVSGHSRQAGLRGIGSDVVSPGGVYLAPGSYATGFAEMQKVLTGAPGALATGGACLRITTPGSKQFINAVSINGVIGAGTLVGTPSSPVLSIPNVVGALTVVPNVIRISGVLGLAGLNGQWTVINTNIIAGNLHVQLAPKRGRTVIGLYVSGGFLQVQNYTLDPIISVTPSQGGSRRTGGSSIRPRGRRSRRQL